MEIVKSNIGLLDTSVQIDRKKSKHWSDHVDEELQKLSWTVATGISLVEFKAVLIQECITIHNKLFQQKKYSLARDSLIESTHRQNRLRAHIFNNILDVHGSSYSLTPAEDTKLAERARLLLEVHILELYKWFRTRSTSAFLNPIKCNRAEEPPKKKKAAYEANLPICKRGVNKTCLVESFLRDNCRKILIQLEQVDFDSEQLTKSIEIAESVLSQESMQLSVSDCRSMGDLLIVLEAGSQSTHALSTNKRDWKPLAECAGLELVIITHQGKSKQSSDPEV